MEVMLAKSAGFCPGVKRAVDMVYTLTTEQHRKGEPVYTYGPIIHNDEVVRDLESKGAKVIHSPEELDGLPKGTVVIRSMGLPARCTKRSRPEGFRLLMRPAPL